MKRFFSILTLVFAATCFVACNPDDEVTDIRDQVVGTYSYDLTTYIYDNGEMSEFLPKESSLEQLTVSKFGNNELICDDGMKFINLKEASNGVVFNIPSYNVDGKTLTGFNGISLSTENYHGLYTSADKKLVLYCKIALADFAEDFVNALDEESILLLDAFFDALSIEDIEMLDTLSENVFVVFKFEAVKR